GNVSLTNSGTVNAASGTLSLQGGGTFTAASTLTAASGGDLDFNGGTFDLPAGSEVVGASGSTFSFSGADVTIEGSYATAGSTTVSNGEVDFNSSTTLPTLIQSGGILGGSATVTVTGATTWSGGTQSGAGKTVAKGGLTIGSATSTSEETLNGRELDNFGAATLANFYSNANGLRLASAATFANEAGASFSFISDAAIYDAGGGG
uniref:hypothetical protein n=1 Tax=Aquisphaera insulae TaxID=2712864 RepID=UPI0013EB4686